jgi:hypothetical protein
MELSALRIGNFFEIRAYYEETGRIRKITEIGKKQVHIDGKWLGINDLIAINITEETLLHAGFKHFNWLPDSPLFECAHFKCKLTEKGVNLLYDDLINLKPIKYLHELQNIYFDLTGDELEINFTESRSVKTEAV